MREIKTFYLIDYENVSTNGLSGCDKLSEFEHIIIFFTQNAVRINMSKIAKHGDAELDMIEIPAGKQSTDIHIASFIGYLTGLYRGKDCSIVVISKDSDFDNVVRFWNSKSETVRVYKAGSIKESLEKKGSVKKTAEVQIDSSKSNRNAKSVLNENIMKILSKAGFNHEIVAFVASTAVKNIDVRHSKQRTYRTIIAKYGQDKGLNIYNHIKKSI